MRIVVVDDHAPVREGLRRLLEAQEDIEVVAEAGDGKEGAHVASELRPTLVLMDGSMPVWDGVQATHAITMACPDVKVIAVTRSDAPACVQAMMRAGARGYVLKQNVSTELLRAVRAVVGGAQYIDRSIQTTASSPGLGDPSLLRRQAIDRPTSSLRRKR
jgi:DNA-binding NarL/FixJ family response regulator